METLIDDRAARRNVIVLVAAQAILGSQMSMLYVAGGLVGQQIAPNPCLATLPISVMVFGSMTTAPWLSNVMQSRGRRSGFLIGAGGGLAGALLAMTAVYLGSFWLLIAASYLTGIYMSAQGFYRFAATDRASEAFRPKAISYVLAGGLASALIGPQLVKLTAEAAVIPFLATYFVVALLNLGGAFVFLGLDSPAAEGASGRAAGGRTRRELFADPRIRVAMICAMVSYGLMSLVMTSTPLAVVGCGYGTDDTADIISAHIVAMFAPAFVTGHLVARFGAVRIVAVGLVLLAGAGAVALSGVEIANFFGVLVLLGIGWNFGLVGATTMLSQAHTPEERGRVQGLNDALVFGCVMLASLASGGLLNCSGGDVVQGWTAVNLAMAPFLALAGGALIWLALRPEAARR